MLLEGLVWAAVIFSMMVGLLLFTSWWDRREGRRQAKARAEHVPSPTATAYRESPGGMPRIMTIRCAVCLHTPPGDRNVNQALPAITVMQGLAVCEDHVDWFVLPDDVQEQLLEGGR